MPLDPSPRSSPGGYDRFRAEVVRRAEQVAGAWGREAAELILFLPDLLLLFAGLARDSRVSLWQKALAGAVVAYLLSPIDVLPEAVLGPLGLADDAVVAFLALNRFLNRVDRQLLDEHWRGNRDLLALARAGLAFALRFRPVRLAGRWFRWIHRRD